MSVDVGEMIDQAEVFPIFSSVPDWKRWELREISELPKAIHISASGKSCMYVI